MIVLPEMAKLMYHNITDYPVRGNDNPPVELTLGAATTPSAFKGSNIHGGGCDAHDPGIPQRFLPELLFCMFSEPLREGVSHSLRAVIAIG
jgi:hypothetical protein